MTAKRLQGKLFGAGKEATGESPVFAAALIMAAAPTRTSKDGDQTPTHPIQHTQGLGPLLTDASLKIDIPSPTGQQRAPEK